MKNWITFVLAVSLSGCVVINKTTPKNSSEKPAPVAQSESHATTPILSAEQCKGSVVPPAGFAGKLTPTTDDSLLQSALGKPEKGGLCNGKVYQVTEEFVIYRAWNSTNSGSKMGSWWAFNEPTGKVAQYREDYEICYQWSPLDMMTQCKITAGSKIVIGSGQSAFCSQYLTYPVSDAQQIFMQDSAGKTIQCNSYEGMFQWKSIQE